MCDGSAGCVFGSPALSTSGNSVCEAIHHQQRRLTNAINGGDAFKRPPIHLPGEAAWRKDQAIEELDASRHTNLTGRCEPPPSPLPSCLVAARGDMERPQAQLCAQSLSYRACVGSLTCLKRHGSPRGVAWLQQNCSPPRLSPHREAIPKSRAIGRCHPAPSMLVGAETTPVQTFPPAQAQADAARGNTGGRSGSKRIKPLG